MCAMASLKNLYKEHEAAISQLTTATTVWGRGMRGCGSIDQWGGGRGEREGGREGGEEEGGEREGEEGREREGEGEEVGEREGRGEGGV